MSYSDAKPFRSRARLSRRDLLKAGTAALALSGLPETVLAAGQHEGYPPVRTVTRGPKPPARLSCWDASSTPQSTRASGESTCTRVTVPMAA